MQYYIIIMNDIVTYIYIYIYIYIYNNKTLVLDRLAHTHPASYFTTAHNIMYIYTVYVDDIICTHVVYTLYVSVIYCVYIICI